MIMLCHVWEHGSRERIAAPTFLWYNTPKVSSGQPPGRPQPFASNNPCSQCPLVAAGWTVDNLFGDRFIRGQSNNVCGEIRTATLTARYLWFHQRFLITRQRERERERERERQRERETERERQRERETERDRDTHRDTHREGGTCYILQ